MLCRSVAGMLTHTGVPGLQPRMWSDQAKELTNSLSALKYRSVAMQAEVRLREALDRCNEVTGAHLQDSKTPHKLRTAVACQLMQELAELAGPFSTIIKSLCNEMVSLKLIITLFCYVAQTDSGRLSLPLFNISS